MEPSAKRAAPAAQLALAKKAAAAKAKTKPTGLPAALPDMRLLSKPEVLAIVNVTYPTLWAWMRNGTFPRSRIAGGRSMWRSDEIDAWLTALPIRPLKGDAAAAVEA
jgi:predicted DNA-binding transcriptional regulator AlpA